ncbi:MAG: hypothetical protein H6581_15750 [Bacteroidia bacterium]|nr:hypothetical protein [Bacteroidia bacterium]
MRKLKEIVGVISRRRIRKIEVFNEGTSKSSNNNLYYRLYKGIRDGVYENDEDAAQDLFQTDSSDKRYQMLKSRVKSKLLNNLFFLESKTNQYFDMRYKCNRDLFAGKFLMFNSALETGYSTLKSTLAEAQKYHFTDVIVNCLTLLRNQAAYLAYESDYNKFSEALNFHLEVYNAEIKAEEKYLNVILQFSKSSSPKPELSALIRRDMSEVKQWVEKYRSHELMLIYFRLQLIYYPTTQEFKKVIAVCNEAEKYLNENEHLAPSGRYAEFALHKMVGYMHLRDYENGLKNAEKCLVLYPAGGLNWMTFQEYYFLLAMHTKNYEKANEIYQSVVSLPKFESVQPRRKEKWKIFEAYLNYIHAVANPEGEEAMQQKFRLFKFLNEVPIYSRDKRGLNVAILILQILFLLDRKDFNGIINRTEALKVYCSRYLRSDENYRSNCFLKMMLAMEKKNFNLDQTRKIARKYYNKLESTRFHYEHGSRSEIEIVPYEHLWNLILNKLTMVKD